MCVPEAMCVYLTLTMHDMCVRELEVSFRYLKIALYMTIEATHLRVPDQTGMDQSQTTQYA